MTAVRRDRRVKHCMNLILAPQALGEVGNVGGIAGPAALIFSTKSVNPRDQPSPSTQHQLKPRSTQVLLENCCSGADERSTFSACLRRPRQRTVVEDLSSSVSLLAMPSISQDTDSSRMAQNAFLDRLIFRTRSDTRLARPTLSRQFRRRGIQAGRKRFLSSASSLHEVRKLRYAYGILLTKIAISRICQR